MKLVCRSCFAVEEPRTALGPVGYVLWFTWLAVTIGMCASMGASEGTIIGVPALLLLVAGATTFIGRRALCPSCAKADLVAPTSPAGLKIITEHATELEAARQYQEHQAEELQLRAEERRIREEDARRTPLQRRIEAAAQRQAAKRLKDR